MLPFPRERTLVEQIQILERLGDKHQKTSDVFILCVSASNSSSALKWRSTLSKRAKERKAKAQSRQRKTIDAMARENKDKSSGKAALRKEVALLHALWTQAHETPTAPVTAVG